MGGQALGLRHVMQQVRGGRYEIVAAIGRGAMGEVYLARDTRLHRQVAIKILTSSEHMRVLEQSIEQCGDRGRTAESLSPIIDGRAVSR